MTVFRPLAFASASAFAQAPALPVFGLITKTESNPFFVKMKEGAAAAAIAKGAKLPSGAGKSSLIKALSGAIVLDEGEILLDGKAVNFRSPIDALHAGVEYFYQDLALAPAMTIAENRFLGRELRREGFLVGSVLRMLDKKRTVKTAMARMADLKVGIDSMTQAVETLSGGQRQRVAVVRAAAFAEPAVILDEPTAALGVKEGNMVLELIRPARDERLPVVLNSHNMPHVVENADHNQVGRVGKRSMVLTRKRSA